MVEQGNALDRSKRSPSSETLVSSGSTELLKSKASSKAVAGKRAAGGRLVVWATICVNSGFFVTVDGKVGASSNGINSSAACISKKSSARLLEIIGGDELNIEPRPWKKILVRDLMKGG